MSRENMDLVRSVLARWEKADFRSLSWADPEIEYSVVGGPEPGTWKGIDEMTTSVRAFMSAWEDYGIEADQYRELDDERVLVLVRLSGRGKISGLRIEDMGGLGAEVWHVRAGRVVKLLMYWYREQALADLGLSR
jgi:ketosteroid isomerase-like protein